MPKQQPVSNKAIKDVPCHCDHIDALFSGLVDLVEEVKRELLEKMDEIKTMEDTMAQTMQELQDAITGATDSVDALSGKVDELIAKVGDGSGGVVDTTEAVSAVNALKEKADAASEKVDAALNPPTPA